MNFEQRKSEAKRLVGRFLGDFVQPRGLDDEALASRLVNVADAFARRMPTKDNFSGLVEGVLMRIRDTHDSNTWPTQATFILAMPGGEVTKFQAPETYKPNFYETMASQMRAGDPVPETFIWSGRVDVLLRESTISRETLDGYRMASVAAWRAVYKHDAERKMQVRFGQVVRRYFEALTDQPTTEAAE